MLPAAAAIVSVLIFAVAGWYVRCRRRNQARAAEILGWVESTLGRHGSMSSVLWERPSKFRVPLHTSETGMFRRAAVVVELLPRELPHRWINSALRGDEEKITFEADLESAPKFELDLHNLKLFARSRRDLQPTGSTWQYEQTVPLIMTTRNEWQKEITGLISAMLHVRDKQFIDLRFARKTPHYTVIMPLDSLAPSSAQRLELSSCIRELAAEATSYHGLSY
jgi:hypothetical protein